MHKTKTQSQRMPARRDWEQPSGKQRRKFESNRICEQFFIGTEKKYAINELELLAVVWGLEIFPLYFYGKPIELLTDHQALPSTGTINEKKQIEKNV